MATYTNQTKNSSSITNQAKGGAQIIWNDADFAWQDAGTRTWNDPSLFFTNAAKNSSSLTNGTKNSASYTNGTKHSSSLTNETKS